MEYQIVRKDAFRIVGFRTPLTMDVEESFQAVPRFWGEVGPRIGGLVPLMSPEMPGVLGVSTCHHEAENSYYIAVASDAPVPEGLYEWTIPAATWAVFTGQGQAPMAIQELQKRIVSEWLPDSGYEWAQAPDVEVYLNGPDAAEAQFQVWLPVQRSKIQ